MVTNIRSRAVKWAHERAAEMVGMKWVGGELIQNPAAEWQITEGTREMIRGQVVEAMRNGDSVQELAGRLKESHAFSNAAPELLPELRRRWRTAWQPDRLGRDRTCCR